MADVPVIKAADLPKMLTVGSANEILAVDIDGKMKLIRVSSIPLTDAQRTEIALAAQGNYMGNATTSTDGSIAPENAFWTAVTPGAYPGLGNVTVLPEHFAVISKYGTSFSVQQAPLGSLEYIDSKVATLSVSQIRALSTNQPPQHIVITDYGLGIFIFDPSDSVSLDNTGTILVDTNGNRYKRMFSGAVNAEWFGAIGDYDKANDTGTDNTDYFQAAIDYLGSIPVGGGELTVGLGTYLIAGTIYVNYTGSRPFTFNGNIANSKNSSANLLGVTLVKNTAGDMIRTNLDSSGNRVLGSTSQFTSFSLKGFNAVATVPGINMLKQFRTRSNIQEISTYNFDWTVLQENTDAGGSGNYCDQSIYKFIKIGSPRIGGLRLCKADVSEVSEIYFEGDETLYEKGIEIVTADSVNIKNILQWFQSGATVTPIANSKLINLANCTAVDITTMHIEHCPHDNIIALSGCTGVRISGIYDKFERRGGILIGGASKGVSIENWESFSTILAGAADITVGFASNPITGVTYTNCYFRSNPGAVSRQINIDANNRNSVREILTPKKVEISVTDNINAEGNSSLFLLDITANKVITLPAFDLNFGKEIVIHNRNTSTFTWSLNVAVKDCNGVDLIIIKPNSIVTLECDTTSGPGWRIKSEYTDPYLNLVVGTNADYIFTRANTNLYIPSISANRVITLPNAVAFRARTIIITNDNNTAFTASTSPAMLLSGVSVSALPNRSTTRLTSDGANWRIESQEKFLTVVATNSSTAATVSKADLNAAYPSAITGFLVEYPGLTGGAKVAQKIDNSATGNWILYSGSLAT